MNSLVSLDYTRNLMHHRIKSVEPLSGMSLLVEFRAGTVK